MAEEKEVKNYGNFHAYGGKAALDFKPSETRAGIHTISIEGAKLISEKKFDWNDKVSIQITRAELPMVAAVFFAKIESCKFANHGADKTKGFEIKCQPSPKGGKHFYVNLYEKNKPGIAVQVNAEDAVSVFAMIVVQMRRNWPHLSSDSVIEIIKQYAATKR